MVDICRPRSLVKIVLLAVLGLALCLPLLLARQAQRSQAIERSLRINRQLEDSLLTAIDQLPPGVTDVFAKQRSIHKRWQWVPAEHIRSRLKQDGHYEGQSTCGLLLKLDDAFWQQCQAGSKLAACVLMEHIFRDLSRMGFSSVAGPGGTRGSNDATQVASNCWSLPDGSITVVGTTFVASDARQACVQLDITTRLVVPPFVTKTAEFTWRLGV